MRSLIRFTEQNVNAKNLNNVKGKIEVVEASSQSEEKRLIDIQGWAKVELQL